MAGDIRRIDIIYKVSILKGTVQNLCDTIEALGRVSNIARMVVDSPPRSAQLGRLVSKLKEKIEELDKE